MRWMDVDHEMLIGCVREETDGVFAHRSPSDIWQERLERTPKRCDLARVHRAANRIGISHDLALVHHGGLDPTRQPGKAVAPSSAVFIYVNGTLRRLEARVIDVRLEPEKQLPLDR